MNITTGDSLAVGDTIIRWWGKWKDMDIGDTDVITSIFKNGDATLKRYGTGHDPACLRLMDEAQSTVNTQDE